jgi:outer membrane lipoprotein-sorting protein
MKTIHRRALLLTAAASLLVTALGAQLAWAAPLDGDEMKNLLKSLDDRQRNMGDYKALVFIDQKEKGKNDLVYEAVIYRRDTEGKLVILFLKPKSEAGKGYLRLEKNLFMYDPTVGKWERRTERESIGGTNSQRRDFDAPSFAEDFDATYVAEEKLGKYAVHHLKLKAKDGKDVAYPVVELWVDAETGNMLKVQEFALSGKLMRTAYYPKWERVFSKDKGSDVYFPKEIRLFDEIEKGNSTTIIMRKVDLEALPDNIFTKAWLESKSR